MLVHQDVHSSSLAAVTSLSSICILDRTLKKSMMVNFMYQLDCTKDQGPSTKSQRVHKILFLHKSVRVFLEKISI